MGYFLKQSQTTQPLVFLLIGNSDHITGATGVVPTVTLSKNGGAFASPAGAVSEIGNGWYSIAGNATDSATLGPLIVHATGVNIDPCDVQFHVVAFDPLTATNLGLSALPTASPASNGGLPTVDASNSVKLQNGTGANQINLSSGLVSIATSGINTTSFVQLNELASMPTLPNDPLTLTTWIFTRSAHKTTTTGSLDTVFKKNGTTPLASSVLTDDNVTFTRPAYA